MSWLAINDSPGAGAGQVSDTLVSQEKLLIKGSLIIDVDFRMGQKAPCKLLTQCESGTWNRSFNLFLNPDYSLSLEIEQGDLRTYVRLSSINLRDAGAVRLTYSWDAPRKYGLLTAEDRDDGAIYQAQVDSPIPYPMEDAIKLITGTQNSHYDERLVGLALSDHVAPIGPAPTIAAGAQICTDAGHCPIERLNIGDMVLTGGGQFQPVRSIISQRYPAIGTTAPVKIRAPFFGLDDDLMVAMGQRLLLSSIDNEYNLGQSTIQIEAGGLIGHPAVSRVDTQLCSAFYQVLVDSHDFMQASGAWVETLYVGYLKNSPDILATTALSGIPMEIIPLHRPHAHPVLRDYERQALLETLTA
ncbi:MAG: Hint domain-containing protein [Paracoccaceae bacterium]